MTAEEKAKELFDKMYLVDDIMGNYPMCFNTAKQCAIIAVNSIIDALTVYDDYTEKYLKDEFGVDYFSCELQNMDSDFRYWHKVLHYLESF